MKKTYFLFAALLLFVGASFAQNSISLKERDQLLLKRLSAERQHTNRGEALPLEEFSPFETFGNIIFRESFESAYYPNWPTGWTLNTDPEDLDLSWAIIDAEEETGGYLTAPDGNNIAIKFWSELEDGKPHNAWLQSPDISLIAETNYTISFWLSGMGDGSAKEKMEVMIGFASETPTQIYNNTDIDMDWTLMKIPFTAPKTGLFRIGFHAYSDYDGFYIAIDDVQVEQGSVGIAEMPCNAALQVYPNPTTGELHIGYPISDYAISDIVIYDVYGRMLETVSRNTEIGKSEIKIDISHLPAGIYFLKMAGETVKVVKTN